jgi:dienelactone hydrolase
LLALVASLAGSIAMAASEQVEFAGAQGAGFPFTDKVTATLQIPENAKAPMPAVAIFHGSAGIDGRGAFHAEAFHKAGFATLEVFMFHPGQRLKEGHTFTLTHAYGALKYLASRSDIDPQKIGMTGYSWGGNLTLRAASQSTYQAFFPAGGPMYAAHAAFYPVWWYHSKLIKESPDSHPYMAFTGAPVLLFAGGYDDFGDPDAAQQFVSQLPESAKSLVTLQYYPDATHGFDAVLGKRGTLFDPQAANGKGARVRIFPDFRAAEDARAKTVAFFLKAFGL